MKHFLTSGQKNSACRRRPRPDFFLGGAVSLGLLGASMLTPAMAQDTSGSDSQDERIEQLEHQLDEAMRLINSLSQQIQALSAGGAAPGTAGERLQEIELATRETEERVTDVEDQVFDLEERVGSRALAKAFEARSLDIGGFLHSTFTHVEGEDGSASSFNRQTFELLASADLSENWSAFIAQAFIRESDPNFTDAGMRRDPGFAIQLKTPTVIAWANYRASDALNLRIGRWITPHGIINIEHFPALLLDPEQPQFLRPFGGQTMFANFMTGFQVHGQQFMGMDGRGKLSYAAYVGNFANNANRLNYGGRVAYAFGDTGVELGANVGGGKRTDNVNSDYVLYGGDLRIERGQLLWKSEIFATDEDLGGDRLAWYTQPAWRFAEQWTAFYRYDFLDDGSGRGDRTENVVGLTFKPVSNIHLRSIFTLRDWDLSDDNLFGDADAEIYQLSATFSF